MKPVIIVPAFNEEAKIAGVVSAIRRYGHDIIVVDDCSSDATSDKARSAGAVVIRHKVNKGKGGAVLTGVEHARKLGCTHTLVMDADGQHDPAEIPLFIAAAPNADIVLGSRMKDPGNMPSLRRLTNRSMSIIIGWWAGKSISDTQCGFRMVSMPVWDVCHFSSSRYDMESELLITACRAGFSLAEVSVKAIYADEVSTINPWVDTLRFFRLLGRLSMTRPWRGAIAERRRILGLS